MIPQIEEVNFPSYATLHQATVTLSDMGERTIETQVRIDGSIVPEYGVTRNGIFYPMELVFKGERFILPIREPQALKDNTTRNSLSNLTFYSWPIYQLKRYFFFSTEPQATGTAVADQYIAPVKTSLSNFVAMFNRVLDYYFPEGEIIMSLYSQPSADDVLIEIDYSYLWDVLVKFYEAFGVRWYIDHDSTTGVYTIKVNYPSQEVQDHIFEYGYEGGLLKFERQVQDPEIYNILLGRGGEKNLPYRYFKLGVTDGGYTWRGDPDAIPELASIYFDRLRDINFRWYIRGWVKNAHRNTSQDAGYTLPDYDEDDVPEAYLWAYRKGRYEDERFNPVEYVKDDESIAKYGELWGAADNMDDVYPTIQGRFADGIGRIDESVAFSEIVTDDIQAAAANAAVETTLPDTSVSLYGNAFSTFTLVSNTFTIPAGKTANASFMPFGTDKVWPGQIVIDTENSTSKAVSHNTGVSDIEGTSEAISAIPAGSWHIEFTLVLSGTDQSHRASGDFGFNNIRLTMSDINPDAWKPTFDIWVKNIWGTAKGATESAKDYAERVWLPILGDRWGNEAKLVFSDGPLASSEDYEFVIASIPVYDTTKQITTTDAQGNIITVPSEWRITLRKSDAEFDATGLYIPNATTGGKPVDGNHFYFIGIDMPQQYVEWAEELLNGTAFVPHVNKKKILDEQGDINPSWVVTLDKVRAHTVEASDLGRALVDRIKTGALLSTRDSRFTGGETMQLYITTLTYTWSEPTDGSPNIVPEIEIVLSDKIASVSSAFGKLQGAVNVIQRNYATNEDIEAVVRRIASEFFLKKNGEPDSSESPTAFASKVASADFSQGQISGRGWGIYRSNAPEVEESSYSAQDAILELDVLRVRKSLEVNEIVAHQTTHVGGRRIQSAAAITCSQVVDDGARYICYFDQKQDSVRNLFVVGDVALLQNFDAENNLIRYSKRKVVEVGLNYISLSQTDVDGTGVPETGDVLVQYGNYTNVERQYVIVQDVIGGGYEQMIAGLDSVSATGVEYYFAGRVAESNPRWFVGNRASGQFAEFANGKFKISGPASIGQDGNATEIVGNLLQTGTISLGSVSNGAFSVWAGMSGVYDTALTNPGKSVAAWYGGPKVDHEADASAQSYAKSLFRFDGSGYLAGGNIKWDAYGYGQVPGISWSNNGIYITNDLRVATNDGGDFVTIVDFVKEFASWFGEDANGDIYVKKRTVNGVETARGFYGYGFITAGGANPNGGGIQLNEPLFGINNAGLSDHPSASGQTIVWNGSAWVYGNAGGGGSENAVLYVSQSLSSAQKAQARTNIGAGTSSFSGSYNDLSNKPTIPAAQVQTDWNATTGMGAILNKPNLGSLAYKNSLSASDIPDISGTYLKFIGWPTGSSPDANNLLFGSYVYGDSLANRPLRNNGSGSNGALVAFGNSGGSGPAQIAVDDNGALHSRILWYDGTWRGWNKVVHCELAQTITGLKTFSNHILPGANNSYNLGSNESGREKWWANAYITNVQFSTAFITSQSSNSGKLVRFGTNGQLVNSGLAYDDIVTRSGSQTITGQKTFSAAILSSGYADIGNNNAPWGNLIIGGDKGMYICDGAGNRKALFTSNGYNDDGQGNAATVLFGNGTKASHNFNYYARAHTFYIYDSTASSNERVGFQVTSYGNISRQVLRPHENGSIDLGTSSYLWNDLFAKTWRPTTSTATGYPKMTYNSSEARWEITGNLIVTGYVTAGGVNSDGNTTLRGNLIPATTGLNIGSENMKLGCLYTEYIGDSGEGLVNTIYANNVGSNITPISNLYATNAKLTGTLTVNNFTTTSTQSTITNALGQDTGNSTTGVTIAGLTNVLTDVSAGKIYRWVIGSYNLLFTGVKKMSASGASSGDELYAGRYCFRLTNASSNTWTIFCL